MVNKPERIAQLRRGPVKRLHVDKHVIMSNLKNGTDLPPITIQTTKGSLKVRRAKIRGASEFIYSPEKPLHCGARLWIETRAQVEIDHGEV